MKAVEAEIINVRVEKKIPTRRTDLKHNCATNLKVQQWQFSLPSMGTDSEVWGVISLTIVTKKQIERRIVISELLM